MLQHGSTQNLIGQGNFVNSSLYPNSYHILGFCFDKGTFDEPQKIKAMYQFVENVHSFQFWANEQAATGSRGKVDERTDLARAILQYYQTHTARETCAKFKLPYTGRIIKILHRAYPKNLGWGGRRKGAGKPSRK